MSHLATGRGEPPAGAGAEAGRISAFGVLVALWAVAGTLCYFRVVTPDAFWHIKTGQVIIQGRQLLHTNLFSNTHPDYPWHNLEWLFQVLLASVYNGFGWGGVMVFKIVLVQATATVLYLTLLSRARAPLPAAAVVLFVLALMRFRFTERPHLLSFLFFAIVIWVVERRRESGRVLWLLPPLFALWSNCHPELILVLAYLGATVVGGAVDTALGKPLLPSALRREALVLGSCALATLANPEGWRVLQSALWFAAETAAPVGPAILEYSRSTLRNGALFWVLVAVVAVLLLRRRQDRSWAVVLPLATLAALGAYFARGTTVFAMAAAPLVHAGLLAPPDAGFLRRWAQRTVVLLTAGAALLWAWFLDPRQTYRWGHGPDEASFPAAAASFILANDLPPNLYNHYNDGGYLIFRLYPRLRVFQDGRGPYPPAFYRAATGRHTFGEIRRLFDDYGVNTALVTSGEIDGLLPGDTWGVVYWDDRYAVLVRRSPANFALLERLEYRVFLPGKPLPQSRDGLLRMLSELRRSETAWSRPDWRLSVMAAKTQLNLRDFAGAERDLLQATALAPDEPEPWALLSVVRRQLGRDGESAAAAARRLDPEGRKIRGLLGD